MCRHHIFPSSRMFFGFVLATHVVTALAAPLQCWGLNEEFFSRISYTSFPVLHAHDHPQLQLQRAFLPGSDGDATVCMTKLLKLPKLLLVIINHQHLYAIDSDTNVVLWERICEGPLHVTAANVQTVIVGCHVDGTVGVFIGSWDQMAIHGK